MIKKFSILLILIIFTGQLFAQKKVWVNFAEEALARNDYYSATKHYLKALTYDSLDIGIHYNLGKSYLGYFQLNLALKEFEIVKNSNAYIEFPEVDFYLAKVYKHKGDYKKSNELFSYFVRNYNGENQYLKDFAKNENKVFKSLLELLKDTSIVQIKNVNILSNSSSAEFAPYFLNDSLMWYTSNKLTEINKDGEINPKSRNYTNIHSAIKKDSVWVDSELINFDLEDGDIANSFFDLTDSLIYFTYCSPEGCDIWTIKVQKNKFIEPIKLSINEPNFITTNPNITEINNVKVMFFSSNREGGKGNMDIYMSSFKNNSWTKPQNLGNSINSKGNEITPYFHKDSNVLYFSSDWHCNLGGFDIFKSTYLQNFSSPINIGIPYNTSRNDLYYTRIDSLKGFLTSNRIGSKTDNLEVCCNDIYEFNITPKKVEIDTLPVSPQKVVENQIIALLDHIPVRLFFHNDIPNPDSRDTITSLNYLETYFDYILLKDTYKEEYPKSLAKDKRDEGVLLIDSFFINNVEKGMVDLEYFADTLYNILQKGFSIQITAKGYASPLAKNDYNINLSKRRINSFQNYLRGYPKGDFNQFLDSTAQNGAYLFITTLPNGEEKSNPFVSDNYYDIRNSIYNPAAAYERRVEVEDLFLIDDKKNLPLVAFKGDNQFTIDLGVQDSLAFTFDLLLQNQLYKSIKILDTEVSCGCTKLAISNMEISPLHRQKLKVSIIKEEPGNYKSQLKFITEDQVYFIDLIFEVR